MPTAANRFIGVFLLLCTQLSWAQNPTDSKQVGEYTIHYSVFNSLFLPAEIAQQHQLVRAGNRALINITVHETDSGEVVPVRVSGNARNLLQQTRNIDFKHINEGDAHYAIGTLRHSNEEVFHFHLEITPEGAPRPLNLQFTQKLHTDG